MTPFDGQNWSEWTTRSKTPIFKWKQKGKAIVTVLDLDSAPPVVLWTGSVDGSHLAYPADAPPLQIGIPYQARVTIGDADPIGAAFSIDPDLDGPDTVLSRIIPVGK